jgi:hypothetical protein
LSGASARLEDTLVELRRSASSREHLLMLPELLAELRGAARDAACSFDEAIVARALTLCSGTWSWPAEYRARALTTPRGAWSVCPYCGAASSEFDHVDFAVGSCRRVSQGCAYCGVVFDLPVWPLSIEIQTAALDYSATRVSGRVRIDNRGASERRVAVGIGVGMAGDWAEASRSRGRFVLAPGASETLAFRMVPARPLNELAPLVVATASEGSFGIHTMSLLFRAGA